MEHLKKFGRNSYQIAFKSNCINFAVILVYIFMLYLKFRLSCFECRFDLKNRPIFGGTVADQSSVIEQKLYSFFTPRQWHRAVVNFRYLLYYQLI